MCVYFYMLKKIRVGRLENFIFLNFILNFITELMLDGIYIAFLYFKNDI